MQYQLRIRQSSGPPLAQLPPGPLPYPSFSIGQHIATGPSAVFTIKDVTHVLIGGANPTILTDLLVAPGHSLTLLVEGADPPPPSSEPIWPQA